MDYFPHLNLGNMQFYISIVLFVLCFAGLFLLALFMKKRKKMQSGYLTIAVVALVLTVPSCVILDVTAGNVIFRKMHFQNNEHMPAPAECIEYNPAFSYLKAKYKVSPAVLKRWVEKYKLKEEPANTFKSKVSPNGQGITAIYDPTQEILAIKYNAF